MKTKESVLKEYFGYSTFRPQQDEIIDHVINGNDALVLMPTGGGKSLCFQVSGLVMEGICVVVSPLISLMKDQVDQLKSAGVGSEFLNSSLSYPEQKIIEEACISGKIKFLYISPEKLFSEGFINFLTKLNINLFAIDEAHCVSFWGHDFRPEYTRLKELKKHFPAIPVIALTATADKLTRKDILTQLNIEEAPSFISSFDRPNLSLNVAPARKRYERIVEFVRRHKGEAGIVYCLSRKLTEDLAGKLRAAGFKAAAYHAGMSAEDRGSTQEKFLRDDIQIVCATIAFGMGINKSNVRWVIHHNLPKNIENFYQEIGRAGRDGMPAETLLFYSFSDFLFQLQILADSSEERKELQKAKLERMKQYAEADICRRRILLSYFNEPADSDCGNCDVCLNPRQKFNATLLAQKALSAIARTGETIAMGMATDILRGSRNKNVLDKGYHNIKTFGAGRELRNEEWNEYLLQMLNSGIIDIAYDENHALKLNEQSWKVLKENKEVLLVRFQEYAAREKAAEPEVKKTKKEAHFEKLFDRLRKLRKELADANNVPAYVIFNDATITQMAKDRPTTYDDMLNISGVGQQKLTLYGDYFMNEIIAFMKEEASQGEKIEGSTYLLTYDLYQQGLSLEAIAQQRNLNPVTIASHFSYLYEKGHNIDLRKYVAETEYSLIKNAVSTIGINNNSIKPIYEYLEEKIDYGKIRIAITLMKKELIE